MGFVFASFTPLTIHPVIAGLLLLVQFTSPFQLPYHPAGAGTPALRLLKCQACAAARMAQGSRWLCIQALPREGLGSCVVPFFIASATCHAYSYHGERIIRDVSFTSPANFHNTDDCSSLYHPWYLLTH